MGKIVNAAIAVGLAVALERGTRSFRNKLGSSKSDVKKLGHNAEKDFVPPNSVPTTTGAPASQF